jgi:maltose O-acetyltransferase
VLKGVRIGAGAVIQPGALVIENVPAGATVCGNPAKPFNDNQ